MKKLIFTVLAALSFTACVHEKMENIKPADAIAFENSFKAYTTRAAEIDASNLKDYGFNVWGGLLDPEPNNKLDYKEVFTGNPIKWDKNSLSWKSYSVNNPDDTDTKYWSRDHEYHFWAVAPVDRNKFNNENFQVEIETDADNAQTVGNVVGEFNYTTDGQDDLIFSYAKYRSLATGEDDPVNLKFQHLLSKVNISFINNVDPHVNIIISDVKVNAHNSASFEISDNIAQHNPISDDEKYGSWAGHAIQSTEGNSPYNFDFNGNTNSQQIVPAAATEGAVSVENINPLGITESLFFIPSTDQDINISFTITLRMDGVSEILYQGTKTATISDYTLEQGHAYNFYAKITSDVMVNNPTFEIEHIKDWYWNEYGKTDSSDGFEDNFSIKSELMVASKLGGIVDLRDDVTLTDTINVLSDLTINLNGNTLTIDNNSYLFNVERDAKLTITGNSDESIIKTTKSSAYIAQASSSNSEIIITGGHHISAGPTAYSLSAGKIKVTDGKFETKHTELNSILKIEENTEGSILVSGGSFYKWDPSDGDGESKREDKKEKNYLDIPIQTAAKYIVLTEKKADWYIVEKKYEIDNNTDMLAGFNDGEASIIEFENKTTISNGRLSWISNQDTVSIYMNESTLEGLKTNYSIAISEGAYASIYNGNIKSGGVAVLGHGTTLNLYNCDVDISGNTGSAGRYCIYTETESETGKPITINIYGGTYKIRPNSANKQDYYFYATYTVTISVYDGEFGTMSSRSGSPFLTNGDGKIIIYGGYFGFDPSAWCDENCYVVNIGTTRGKGYNEWQVLERDENE